VGSFAKIGTAAVAMLAIGLLAGYWLWGRDALKETAAPPTPVLPAEYVYLDTARATTYLSQISNGLSSGEQRTLTHARELSGSAETALKIGVSQTDTAAVLETVTPTNTSQFSLLMSRLDAGNYNSGKPWLTKQDCFPRSGGKGAWKTLKSLPEGAFIQLHDCLVKYPDDGLVFPYFARPLSVPLRLTIGTGASRVTLLLPLATSSVTDPSLFVGHLIVVGKLMRTVNFGAYRDPVTVARIEQALVQLGKKRLYAIPFPAATKTQKPQKYLLGQMKAALRVPAHGAIILPIAIYK
jgi:hypothetical protein